VIAWWFRWDGVLLKSNKEAQMVNFGEKSRFQV